MKLKNILIIIFIFSTFSKCENIINFGIDYNSLLYEFEKTNEHSFYYNFGFNGNLKVKKSSLNYSFSFLYPFSYSFNEKKPLEIGIGNLNYKNFFHIHKNKKYELSFFLNFKKTEDTKTKVPVEEETFNFYGIDNSIDIFSNFKFKFGFNTLQTKNYEIFQNKKFYSNFKFLIEKNDRLKFFSDLNFSKYYFDKKVLDISEMPIPKLKEHNEKVFSFDLGFEYFSYYIFNFILFFQKKEASIEDLSNKSIGFEGFFSTNLNENLKMIFSIRLEKRYLKKSYLFFEPNILTDIGTSYIYIKFNKDLTKKDDFSIIIGRFVHDAREDFFETNTARYKISISFNHIL